MRTTGLAPGLGFGSGLVKVPGITGFLTAPGGGDSFIVCEMITIPGEHNTFFAPYTTALQGVKDGSLWFSVPHMVLLDRVVPYMDSTHACRTVLLMAPPNEGSARGIAAPCACGMLRLSQWPPSRVASGSYTSPFSMNSIAQIVVSHAPIMSVVHHSKIHSHGTMNHLAPFLSNPPLSSYPRACTPEHVFSSPLPECYVSDTELDMRAANPSIAVSDTGYKKDQSFLDLSSLKQPIVQDSQHVLRSQSGVEAYSASKLHKVLFDTTKRVPFDKKSPSSVPKISDQSTRNTRPKPLLSPIILTPPTGVSDTSDSTEDTPYDLAHNHEPTMDPARTFVDENRCPFPPHKMNAISNDCQDATRGESSLSLGSNIATHRRSLSMVENFVSTFPLEDDVGRRCHRNFFGDRRSAAKSKELRRSAGSLSLKKNCGPWVDQIVEATKLAGAQQPHEIGHRSSNNLRNKPRLWLDATNPEQGVAQAVRFHGFHRTASADRILACYNLYPKSDQTEGNKHFSPQFFGYTS